jgi:hypothetical protein
VFSPLSDIISGTEMAQVWKLVIQYRNRRCPLKLTVASVMFFALALPLAAATIGSGQLVGDPNSLTTTFTLVGPNFTVNGSSVSGNVGGCGGCPAGTPFPLSVSIVDSDVFLGLSIIDGVTYQALNLGDAAPAASALGFNGGTVVLTGPGTFRTPFRFSGRLAVIADVSGEIVCLTCKPEFVPLPISGAGIATIHVIGESGDLSTDLVTYTFTPEPATFYLGLIPLAAFGVQRFGRHSEKR